MKLIIKNSNILPLSRWLSSVALPGSQSRARTRFIDMLSTANEEFFKERDKIRDPRIKKDKDGDPLLEDNEETGIKSVVFKTDKDKEDSTKEFEDLLAKDVELVVKDDIFQEIKHAIFGTGDKFNGELATQYDEWCEAFENAK